VKPKINSVEVHPQLSNNGHPVDGVLVGAGSPCLCFTSLIIVVGFSWLGWAVVCQS